MNLSKLKSFFTTKKHHLSIKSCDTELIKRIKAVCIELGFDFYENITIYHHSKHITLPLFILNPKVGVYIFEHKNWNIERLKNAKAKKTQNQKPSDDSLSFDILKEIINQKYKELTHEDALPIINFLILDNMEKKSYGAINDELQTLLPRDKIIFKDSTHDEISNKLTNKLCILPDLLERSKVLSSIFIQYLIHSEDGQYLATDEQKHFIDFELKPQTILSAIHSTGKTNTLLLKALLYKLQHPKKHIIILSHTTLSCDILKQKLINVIEHAIIELDLMGIEIITPAEFLNKHREKLKQPTNETLHVDQILMQKKLNSADLLICDDCDFLDEMFISYLKHTQNNANLILAYNTLKNDADLSFSKQFITPQIKTIQTNQLAKAMQLTSSLSQTQKNILVVAEDNMLEYLAEDLSGYMLQDLDFLHSSKHLFEQKLHNIVFANFTQIIEFKTDIAIILQPQHIEEEKLQYAISIAKEKVYLLVKN